MADHRTKRPIIYTSPEANGGDPPAKVKLQRERAETLSTT
jgi:hypothetical protein